MSEHDGGPAFPSQVVKTLHDNQLLHGVSRYIALWTGGMSLRDWFAWRAMQAYIAADDWPEGHLAEVAYWVADAMLAERAKGGGDE